MVKNSTLQFLWALIFSALQPQRLSILTQREIDDLYGLPRFSDEDRQLYFDLSATERARVEAIRTVSATTHFILQLGYFKAKRQFFRTPAKQSKRICDMSPNDTFRAEIQQRFKSSQSPRVSNKSSKF